MSDENKGSAQEPKAATVKGLAKELGEFKNEVGNMFGQIMNQLQSRPAVATAPVAVVDEAAPDANQVSVPPAWRKLVEQILGTEFDCEYVLPEDGGQLFKIIVPREKSNATPEYWATFRRDVRTKELGNTGVKGVKEWCLKVRANLLRSEIKLPTYP